MATKQAIVDQLKENGIRPTAPRIEILLYIDRNRTHPDAKEIFNGLRTQLPSLSLNTVYSALDAFVEKNMIDGLTISGTEKRYETYKGMHHHFMCECCGKITDIDISCPYLDGMMSSGAFIREVHGYFKGICKGCLKTTKGNDPIRAHCHIGKKHRRM